MFYLCPIPKQFVDHSGLPYAHGKVFVYLTGDSQLAEIYADAEGESLMENPAELDANGCWQCFVPSDIALDYIVQDVGGNVIAKFEQVVPGTGEGSGQGVTKAYVDRQDNALRAMINNLGTALEAEAERAVQAETQARSTVSEGTGISVTPSTQPDGHTDFQIKNKGVVSIDIRSPGETLNIQHNRDDQSGQDTILVDVVGEESPAQVWNLSAPITETALGTTDTVLVSPPELNGQKYNFQFILSVKATTPGVNYSDALLKILVADSPVITVPIKQIDESLEDPQVFSGSVVLNEALTGPISVVYRNNSDASHTVTLEQFSFHSISGSTGPGIHEDNIHSLNVEHTRENEQSPVQEGYNPLRGGYWRFGRVFFKQGNTVIGSYDPFDTSKDIELPAGVEFVGLNITLAQALALIAAGKLPVLQVVAGQGDRYYYPSWGGNGFHFTHLSTDAIREYSWNGTTWVESVTYIEDVLYVDSDDDFAYYSIYGALQADKHVVLRITGASETEYATLIKSSSEQFVFRTFAITGAENDTLTVTDYTCTSSGWTSETHTISGGGGGSGGSGGFCEKVISSGYVPVPSGSTQTLTPTITVPEDGKYLVLVQAAARAQNSSQDKYDILYRIEKVGGSPAGAHTFYQAVDGTISSFQDNSWSSTFELTAGDYVLSATTQSSHPAANIIVMGFSIASIGGGSEATEEAVQKLEADLDAKLTTTMNMADIQDCYDMASNSYGISGNLLGFTFNVPINNQLRLNDTKLGVYAKQNYSTKVILGLYEYNFEGNNGAGQTLWVCDTGPVNIVAGRNEFPIKHLRSTEQELKADRVYYASVYFPNGKSFGCYLAGCPGYADTVNARPQFTLGADNISLDVSNPNASLADTGFWASGYNERPSIPRFFMQIRNLTSEEPPASGPFDNLASFSIQNRTLSQMGFTDQPANNGIVFKKVIPREAVTIKKWSWIDDQSNAEWGHGWRVCNGTMQQLTNSSNEVTFTNTSNGDGTYLHEATHSSGLSLAADTVYWFPVHGNTSNVLNSILGGYQGTKQDDLRMCQSGYNIQWGPSWDLNSSNAFLRLEDNNGNSWTI